MTASVSPADGEAQKKTAKGLAKALMRSGIWALGLFKKVMAMVKTAGVKIKILVSLVQVLKGLGAAHALRDAVIRGQPPNRLLQLLKPAHIKSGAYKYLRTIDQEGFRRVRTKKRREAKGGG